MKVRGKRFILIALLSFMMFVFASAGIYVARAADEKDIGLSAPLAERVHVGTVVELPDYYAEVGGQSVKAKASIIAPSGMTYSGTKFVANEPGKYTVQYVVNGAVVDTESCLAVYSAADLVSGNALATVDGIKEYPYKENYKGVAVDVQSGAKITYEQEITMSTLTKNDLLFEATVEPREVGEADFKQMIITFTDVEDETVYFRVTVTDGHADGGSPKEVVYINTAANGQTAGGWDGAKWETRNIYGTNISASFRAATTSSGSSGVSIKLFYDAEENALYTNRYEAITQIADYDDPTIFGSTAWSGFKSGKAKLSITFVDLKSEGGRVILNTVNGLHLVDEEIVDTTAPDLNVDLFGQSKAPNAVLGTEYSIFPYDTFDYFDTNVKVKVSVTHENVFTGNVTDVSVKNGKFVTNKLGTYTITYVASDYSGNETVKSYSFDCIAEAVDIEVKGLPDNFSSLAFESVEIPSVLYVGASGGCGDLKITVAAYDPDGTQIALDGYSFVPEKLGEYKIVYTATDYYGKTGSSTLIITAEENDKTVFLNDIVLPEILVSGFEYTIPAISAKTCYNGKVVDCQIDYYVNGVKLEGNTFTASGSEALIECRAYAQNAGVYEKIEKAFAVVDGKGGSDHTAYFYDKSGATTAMEEQMGVSLIVSNDTTVSFANKLSGSAFTLDVTFVATNINFTAMNVILCDAEGTNTVTFRFELLASGVKLTVPGGQPTNFPSVQGYFQMNLSSLSGIVTDVNGSSVAYVDQDDAGNAFDGFASGLYLKLAFEGVSRKSMVTFNAINNQTLGTRSSEDLVGPEIVVSGEIPSKAKVGDKVTIYAASAYDVLSQVKNVTVTVRTPSLVNVISGADISENLTLTVTEKGYYTVVYEAYDTAENRTRIVQNFRVVDASAPVLSVDFSNMTKSVGDRVTLPKVTASDDSGSVYYDVFVILPSNEVRLVQHCENGVVTNHFDKYAASFKGSDDSFVVETKGQYTVTVLAYDDDFNISRQSFTITVK